MKVRFEKVIVPCVVNEVTLWHSQHGFLYDVVQADGRRIGVFYATLICGEGAILHFDAVQDGNIPWISTFSAMKKALKMILKCRFNVIYATIPEEKKRLIQIAVRLGFRIVTDGGFFRDSQKISLLKYFSEEKTILT